MKALYRTLIILGVLAISMACGTAQATTGSSTIDYFAITFDEDGHATINDNGAIYTEAGFAAVDPNTGHNALTYALPNFVVNGIGDILDPNGALSDAISIYNNETTSLMAYYSTLPGTELADTISGGYVPLGGVIATENPNGTWAYYSGGAPGVNNDYYGISSGVPDGGSTLILLGGAFGLICAASRKLRK